MRKSAPLLTGLALGCALYSEVVISPLFLTPQHTLRAGTPKELLEAGDFPRVISLQQGIENKARITARELATLGSAEMAAGRFDDARRHLRRALDLRPTRQETAQIAWDLSQTEYLSNNYDAAHEWALMASRHGMGIRQWHLDYLSALVNTDVYRIEGSRSARVRMAVRNPVLPRLEVQLDGGRQATAVVDSGAVLSIISTELANELALQRLGTFHGTFYGLLGEPITVSFGLIDSMRVGGIVIRKIPVAIMPDQKMNFFVLNRQPFKMNLLLGANLLKEFRLTFDYADESVTFEALGPAARNVVENQNLFFVGFRPFVHAAVNRRAWFLFVLDTGSEITFLNDEQIENTALRHLPKLHGAKLQGLGGTQKMGTKVENVEIGVDKWAGLFKNIPLYSTEQSTALGIVGQDFLKNFRVVIDFGSMRVDLHRERSIFRTASVKP